MTYHKKDDKMLIESGNKYLNINFTKELSHMFNKKVLSSILTAVISLSVICVSFNGTAASALRGDANGDGVISVRDSAYIASCLSKGIELDISADYNDDGTVNVRDASAISRDLITPYKSYVSKILELVNAERVKAGVKPLELDYSLINAANVRAEEISEVFSHTRPDSSEFSSVLDELDISYYCSGENIAAGSDSAKVVVQQWVNSPGHYSNIINPAFTKLGVGYYYDSNSTYQHYWAQIFKCD